MPLINYEVTLILPWSESCVITSVKKREEGGNREILQRVQRLK